MVTPSIPRKTEAARQLLQASRQALPAALRMLLITVDGRKSLAELAPLARGLGLAPEAALTRLREQGLIEWTQPPAVAATAGPSSAQRLLRAKVFALDLAARMLAGRDEHLREQARSVDSESSFQRWLDECSAEIGRRADPERAALFRERVAAAAA